MGITKQTMLQFSIPAAACSFKISQEVAIEKHITPPIPAPGLAQCSHILLFIPDNNSSLFGHSMFACHTVKSRKKTAEKKSKKEFEL